MEELKNIVMDFGANDCKFISPRSVVTVPWTLSKCKYGCKNYNKRQCCPPIAPTYLETRATLDSYKIAILIQCLDPYEVNRVVRETLDYLGKNGYYKALGYGAKKCEICRDIYDDVCQFPNCAHADQVIPQFDGSGIDVIKTVNNNGYKEEGVKGWGDKTGFKVLPSDKAGGKDWSESGINFYGLVLVE